MTARLKVIALASYPAEAAATRFRVQQFVAPLAQRGITVSVHPFFDAAGFARLYQRNAWPKTLLRLLKASAGRVTDLARTQRADVIFVQREAMMFGPPIFEWLSARVMRRPMVLDLDDATYVSYTSPTYGRVGNALKWFSKTDDLIRWAEVVICGNNSIAGYVSSKNTRAVVIPTIVDTDEFRPRDERDDAQVVLGWIGTHSTFPYLETLFPVIQKLAERHQITLRIIGSGKDDIVVSGVQVQNLPWELAREVRDFQSFDIGLYPIDETLYPGWASGKSGFKAIQYMAVGIPYVATPVGATTEIGEPGVTHLLARTPDEWYAALEQLIQNRARRRAMGRAGREHVLKHYAFEEQVDKLASVLRQVATG